MANLHETVKYHTPPGKKIPFYEPNLMISVTLTGQLTLLMLIERAERSGIPVVNDKTDGVLIRHPRHPRHCSQGEI